MDLQPGKSFYSLFLRGVETKAFDAATIVLDLVKRIDYFFGCSMRIWAACSNGWQKICRTDVGWLLLFSKTSHKLSKARRKL
jgi:hypothetical protein